MDVPHDLATRLHRNRLTRRDTLWLFGASTAGVALLQGCATSPVTGQSIVVGLSEAQERQIDEQQAPHQFSQDLGSVQDGGVNRYVADVGQRLHQQSHRQQMPYSYRVLNANYVNAYTFPAGAVGVTRGIMSELHDESELAALLGHELGHVNARHAAQRQGQAMVAQAVVTGLNVAVSSSQWGALAGLGSQIGASALLSSYSRDNEREADALGQEYMTRAGYPATGMTQLHQILVDQQKETPSLLETMFSSHPMSTERRDTAQRLAETRYGATKGAPAGRERFMDHTAGLRRIKPTIDACKNGETAMAKKAHGDAQAQFASALKRTPQDYAANLRMAQCLQAQGNTQEARRYADAAKTVYPQEAQARKLAGVLALGARQPERAYEDLDAFDRLLPGDPGVTFLKGVSLEGMGDKARAARQYNSYLRMTQRGDAASYSANRLKAWGYLK
ncbi:M48 family metalloprotease [Eleftheria terrae]|uniref:M48 family metalloprotease n=1 Tax=Eleftheria terrae TaxID=1597781 RepID=UPI00263AFFC5|nr:M48 family metalloprotease [Eleftheria terrae]WKB52279.1 M48 family metalloprotease [Eleftheria terrae]